MASKQAAQPAAEEPDAKKAKVEKESEEAAFQEPDAPKDNRPVLKETVTFIAEDTTLNVVPTLGGKMLSSLTEGGMSYLVAGARANVGQKAGRYMFEVKVVCNIFSTHVGNLRPKPMLRIGFSTSASSLVVGDDNGGACFDGDGSFITERKRDMNGCQKYGREHILAVVLNLDSKSPNFNTMALYRDGVSISKAMPLPEALKGKTLFPHVAFRNVSVSVNFGPKALSELPFKCRMLQAAAGSDVVAAPQKKPKDGKYELMLPVSFPDEGTFDWLDSFLEKNPHYTELSDRMIVDWARASGLWTKPSWKSTNDKPAFNFGIAAMDDCSVRRVMNAVVPVVPRNYVVMEVKSNLLSDERKDILKKFNYPCYKKVANVVMGAPNEDFKGFVQNKILKEKQSKADAEWKAKKEAKAKVKRDKEVQEARRKFAEQKEAAAKEAAKKEEKDDVKDEAKEEPKDEGEVKEETEVKAEKDADADVKMEEKVETKEEEESDAEPPAVELTDEEKAKTFIEKKIPDLGEKVLTTSFGKFTTPEEEEGFDEIRYEWLKEDEAKSYLKKWVLNKKQTTRIDDLKPGQAFKDSLAEFEKLFPAWKDKQKAAASATSKKAAKKKDDDDDEEEIDIATVTDVMDIGEGQPLFAKFDQEDWMLTKLRFELAALLTSFDKDVDDPDRVGIPVDHFQFYYGKYFASKTLDPKTFGKKDMNEVVAMIKDVVIIKDGNFISQLSGDAPGPDHFLKLAETNRRERQRRIDAGDESARIKFPEPEPEKPKASANPYPAKDNSEKGGKWGGKGFKGERVVGAAFVPMASAKAESISSEPGMDRKDLPAWARVDAKGDGKADKAGYKGKGFDKDSKASGGKGKTSDTMDFSRPKSFGGSDYGKAPSDYGKASGDYGKTGSDYGKAYGKDKSKDKGAPSGMDVDDFAFSDEGPVVVPKVVAPKSRVVPPRGKSSALPPTSSFDGQWGQAEESAWDDNQASAPPPVAEEEEGSWGPKDSSYSSDKYSSDKNASWNKDSNSSWSRNDRNDSWGSKSDDKGSSWGSKSDDRGSWDRKKYDNSNSWDANDKSSNSWDSQKKSWDRQDNRSWDNRGSSKSWEKQDSNSSKSWGSQDANNPWEP